MKNLCATLLGVAGLVGAADAGIVHTVPAAPITATALVPSGQASAPLDIDNDGTPEFSIHAYHVAGSPWSGFGTYIRSDRPGAYFAWPEILDPLPAGAYVGPGDPGEYVFSGSVPFFEWIGFAGDGAWKFDDPPAYFGFRLETAGVSHFGWARAQITYSPSPQAYAVTVFDYAYETGPGVAIFAGQIPAPGAAMVLGLGAVVAGRRRS
ncbi:MAG: hypothetical protein IT436_04065 [Phycisphaerales bacterium]|nr:hypothetical protein [Phycisphaerales bacterium]